MNRFTKTAGLALVAASFAFGTLPAAFAQDSMKADSMHADTMKKDTKKTDSMHSDSMHSDSMKAGSQDKMKHDDKMAPTEK